MNARRDFGAIDRAKGEAAAARPAMRRRHDDSRRGMFDVNLTDVALNPKNPRYPNDPLVVETAGSLAEVGQLQPMVLVTRAVYLAAYPDQEAALAKDEHAPDATYVVIIGNRRHLGAQRLKWTTLQAVLSPDVGTVGEIEDRILHENIHRQELPPILEAAMLRGKMEREGLSLREVAEKISKTHSYVDSRLGLLELIPEFQALMQREFELPASARTLKLKLARAIAKCTPQRQQEIWTAGPPFSAVIPDYTPPAPQLEVTPADRPADNDAPAPQNDQPVIPDYTSTPDAAAPALPIEPQTPTAASAPAPASVDASSFVDGSSESSGSAGHWPLVVEAGDIGTLANFLIEHLANDDREELARQLNASQ